MPVALVLTIATTQKEHAAFAGTWTAEVPNVGQVDIRIQVTAAGPSGELVAGPNKLPLIEGTITATEIAFKVVAPTGDRTIAFVGTVKGGEIAFTRTVRVHEGGKPGGQGLFGVAGAPAFVAKRVSK